MKRRAVYGVGVGINGREAAMQATQRALDQLKSSKPVCAMVFVAQEFVMAEVLAGLITLLGDTPLWGFSSTCPITGGGNQPRSVVVALLTGSDNIVSVHWFPEDPHDNTAIASQMMQYLRKSVFLPQHILLAADGMNGAIFPLCNSISDIQVSVLGCLASGDPFIGKTFQFGGNQTGAGGLAAAFLSGNFRIGVGLVQGWRDLGLYYHVTRAHDVWLEELDGIPAAGVYARLFGHDVSEWAFPPLSEMARLYPFGLSLQSSEASKPFVTNNPSEFLIRSVVRIDRNGSLRMSAPVPQNEVVHLLVGDPEVCLHAARLSVRKALNDLGPNVHPILAIAFIDIGWQMLFETRPGDLAQALISELETIQTDFPLVGAYTFGQLNRPLINQPPILHNQDLELMIIGEIQ